jgi:hypothetical protein
VCLPDHHRSTRRSGRSARAVGPGAGQRSVRTSVPSTVTCGCPAARAASRAPRSPGARLPRTSMPLSRWRRRWPARCRRRGPGWTCRRPGGTSAGPGWPGAGGGGAGADTGAAAAAFGDQQIGEQGGGGLGHIERGTVSDHVGSVRMRVVLGRRHHLPGPTPLCSDVVVQPLICSLGVQRSPPTPIR